MRKLLYVTGKLSHIGPIEDFPGRKGQTFQKRVLGLDTEDGHIMFFQVRPKNFEQVQFFRVGMDVKVGVYFAGSEKEDKKYNNIIGEEIETL